jgi:translation initiation factor 2B subunit (eIF-2B alpha/beta/delta family)
MNLLVSFLTYAALWNGVLGFTTTILSPLSSRSALQRPFGCYASTKDKQKESTPTSATELVNGAPLVVFEEEDSSLITKDFNASSITEVMDEISRRINDGSTELLQNLTTVMEDVQLQLPDSAATELSDYIGNLANQIQKAQQQELQRQLDELERKFLAPFEQIAFSDAPLFDKNSKPKTKAQKEADEEAERRLALQQELVLAGKNSTLSKTSRMRTSEIYRNFDVAPLYYSIALLFRWVKKASYPSVVLLATYKNMANVIKTKGPRKKKRKGESAYEEYIKDAEAMQSGWKRTGEIAAKGSMQKKWAILRRSAEVWAVFSSFYLKDRRISKKYQSGKWSEERFKEERTQLGMEITQSLLRLGPTFIKVGNAMELVSLLRMYG